MKKGVLLLAVLLLATALSACGGKKEKGIAAHIEINGVELALNAEFTAEKAEALGQTDQVIEAPSCHYDGSDSIYYYPGFTVYTYKQGEKSILYSVEATDGALSTPEGAKVGMTLEEIRGIYGEAGEETAAGISYAIGEGMRLNFRLADGTVSLIEYYAE